MQLEKTSLSEIETAKKIIEQDKVDRLKAFELELNELCKKYNVSQTSIDINYQTMLNKIAKVIMEEPKTVTFTAN